MLQNRVFLPLRAVFPAHHHLRVCVYLERTRASPHASPWKPRCLYTHYLEWTSSSAISYLPIPVCLPFGNHTPYSFPWSWLFINSCFTPWICSRPTHSMYKRKWDITAHIKPKRTVHQSLLLQNQESWGSSPWIPATIPGAGYHHPPLCPWGHGDRLLRDSRKVTSEPDPKAEFECRSV